MEPELLTVEPLCGTWWNLNIEEWRLDVEPCGTSTFKSGTFMWNLVEPQPVRVEPLCGTSTFKGGTFMWNLVEPQLLRVERFCGTSTFKGRSFMWNLVEPQL